MRYIIFFLLLSVSCFGQVKIQALPSATVLNASDFIPISQSAITKKATIENIAKFARNCDSINACIDTTVMATQYYVNTHGSGWSLTGNAGTDPNTNFIGTTDSVGMVIKNISYNIDDAPTINIIGTSLGASGGGIVIGGNSRYSDATRLEGFSDDTINGIGVKITGGTNISQQIGVADIEFIPQNGKIRFDNIGGANGYVLTSDASGNATWQAPYLLGEDSLDFGNIAPNGHQVLTIEVTGAELSDVVTLGIPNASMNDHASYVAWVSATNTVSVKCFNFDGTSFDPSIGLFKVKVIK